MGERVGGRSIWVREEDYYRLASVARRLGIKGASGLVSVLARILDVEDYGNQRFLLVIGARRIPLDVVKWRDYAGLARRLAEAKEENSRLRRALAAIVWGDTGSWRRALAETDVTPSMETSRAELADACEAFTEVLATHGLLTVARDFLERGDTTLIRRLHGEKAWYLLGLCADYIVLKAKYAKDKGPTADLTIEWGVKGRG